MGTRNEDQDILGMSDDEFLTMNSPPASAGGEDPGEVTPDPDNTNTDDDPDPDKIQDDPPEVDPEEDPNKDPEHEAGTVSDEDDPANTDPKDDDSVVDPKDTSKKEDDGVDPKDKKDDKDPDKQDPDPKSKEEQDKDPESKEKEDKDKKEEAPDYEAFYKQVMAPLKANGKTIQLNSPEEAIQLMQMGANYTKKMQAITPYRKVLLMLENNELLDEGKLSYLIDLDKKNPEAIKKLIKEAGIDPMDIDTNQEPTYREGNHRVSDEEAAFVNALEDLRSNPSGTETLQTINSQWDQASKEVLWKSPELMSVIHSQRENGIYERIANEVERRKALGAIPAQTSFITAYKAVGDEMNQAGAFADLVQNNPQKQVQQQDPVPEKTPVATRVQQPKPQVKNGDKASAASATRSTTQKAEKIVNPLAMSDDEFLKKMADRL
jgi:hypothetical protein